MLTDNRNIATKVPKMNQIKKGTLGFQLSKQRRIYI